MMKGNDLFNENEIVVFGNEINNVAFENFTAGDFNLFMSLLLIAKEQGSTKFDIPFQKLKKLCNYRNGTTSEFVADLIEMNQKLIKTFCEIRFEKKIVQFVLFTTFTTDIEAQTLTIKVNEDFVFLLNSLSNRFTMLDLDDFVKLKSKYSKSIYRILAQYRQEDGSGWWETDLEKFRQIMDVPKSYTNMKIMQKIITPALEELKPYYSTIECKPVYAKKKGSPLTGFRFEFTKQKKTVTVAEANPIALPESAKQKNKNRSLKGSKFNNFEPRQLDFEALERILATM